MKPTVKPCGECGKELVWGLTRWPLETTPRHPDTCDGRAYVLRRIGPDAVEVIDIRDLTDPPCEAYPQHTCRVWRDKQAEKARERARARAVIDRMARG